MKTRMNRLFTRMLSNKGYTIDQTILIVAIIAILITLIIITVGWTLINRTSGTKVGAQFKQVEDANATFYADQKVWPTSARLAGTATGADAAVLALMNPPVAVLSYQTTLDASKIKNLLPGFAVSGTTQAGHNLGNGGVVSQAVNTMSTMGAGSYLVVQFTGLTVSDAQEADKAIDGKVGYDTGRFVWGATACLGASAVAIPTGGAPTSGAVIGCYAANAQ